MVTLVLSVMSTQCDHLDGPIRCPANLTPAKNHTWEWSVAGCALWMALTALSAWRQFGKLEEWESNNMWRSPSFFSNSTREAAFSSGMGLFGSKFGVLPMGHPQ